MIKKSLLDQFSTTADSVGALAIRALQSYSIITVNSDIYLTVII